MKPLVTYYRDVDSYKCQTISNVFVASLPTNKRTFFGEVSINFFRDGENESEKQRQQQRFHRYRPGIILCVRINPSTRHIFM